jgi:hypothetical protein
MADEPQVSLHRIGNPTLIYAVIIEDIVSSCVLFFADPHR